MPHFKSTGPISLQGQVAAPPGARDVSLPLKVLTAPPGAAATHHLGAHVSNSTQEQLGGCQFLELARGSDCVLKLGVAQGVPDGCIVLSEHQQYNLKLVAGEAYQWRPFQPPPGAPFELLALEGEVRLLHSRGAGQQQVVDGQRLAQQLARACFQHVLAVNQLLVIQHDGLELVVRITSTDTLSEQEQQEVLGYHCYRGLVCPTTSIYLSADSSASSTSTSTSTSTSAVGQGAAGQAACSRLAALSLDQQQRHSNGHQQHQHPEPLQPQQQAGGLLLANAPRRAQRPPPTNVANIYTRDGEWFPVRKELLRPCIALTKAVRSTDSEAPSTNVDVDTLTFDRVLIYLEALALGRQAPSYAAHLLPELMQAARALGLRPLEEQCQQQLGSRAAALRVYRLQEVVAQNAAGNCWLILDGMVLDVTRWLPEHPGGSRIIPQQSLNLDCARFFELYHASRESFLYLQEFYLGELHPADRADLPMGGREPPSADFLQQLRQYTSFRLVLRPAKSHLDGGARQALQ